MTYWNWNQFKDVPADVRVCPVCFVIVLEVAKEMHREWHEERGEDVKE